MKQYRWNRCGTEILLKVNILYSLEFFGSILAILILVSCGVNRQTIESLFDCTGEPLKF